LGGDPDGFFSIQGDSMKYKKAVVAALSLALLLVGVNGVEAKKWTITQRQEALSSEINKGQKSGDLTLKEADALRGEASGISEKIEKMKSNNGGKLSYADENKVEKSLNKLSQRIQKLQLEKRVK
jgi:hypothetical protein